MVEWNDKMSRPILVGGIMQVGDLVFVPTKKLNMRVGLITNIKYQNAMKVFVSVLWNNTIQLFMRHNLKKIND